MPVEETWQPPPPLVDAPTVVGSGQAVLVVVVLACVLVLGGLSLGGLAEPRPFVETYARIDAVRIGVGEPTIDIRPIDDECGHDASVLTCRLDVGGKSVEVRADRSATASRCAVLADGRPVPCILGAGDDREAGAMVSIVDDLELAPADFRRLEQRHRDAIPTFLHRVLRVAPAAVVLGVLAAFVVFRTLPVTRCTSAARRVGALGTGGAFAAGLICWWIGRLVAAGHVF